MKILLDENMPAKVDYDLGDEHEVRTVKDMRWLGKKNGELLGLAAFNGFDLIITLDRNLKHQQNLDKFALKFIVVLAKNNPKHPKWVLRLVQDPPHVLVPLTRWS